MSAYPYNKEAKNLLANSYLNLKDYKNAILEFENVKQQSPETFKSYPELGLAYLRNGEYQKAKENFESAVKINPNDYISYGNLAVVQSYLKQNEEAYQNYQKLSIEPRIEQFKI